MGMANGWHLDKRVSIGHIVTTAVALVAAITFMMQLQSQVEANSKAIQTESEVRATADKEIEKRMSRTDERNNRLYQQIYDALVRLEEKVDSISRNGRQ